MKAHGHVHAQSLKQRPAREEGKRKRVKGGGLALLPKHLDELELELELELGGPGRFRHEESLKNIHWWREDCRCGPYSQVLPAGSFPPLVPWSTPKMRRHCCKVQHGYVLERKE
jgi:hypothetical protein